VDEIMNTINWLIAEVRKSRANGASGVHLGTLAEGYTAQQQGLEFLLVARGRLDKARHCFRPQEDEGCTVG